MNKKITVLLFAVVAIAITHINLLNKTTEYIAKTYVKQISSYEQANYSVYNSFLNSYMNSINSEFETYRSENKSLSIINSKTSLLESNLDKKLNLEINNINKKFLFDLFLEKLEDKSIFNTYLNEFNKTKKENNTNTLLNTNKVPINVSIKVENDTDMKRGIITYVSTNIEDWDNFLKFLEKKIKIEIQKNLALIIKNYLNQLTIMKENKIKDINMLLTFQNEEQTKSLKLQKNIIENSQYIESMAKLFNESPLSDPENFYAAKIDYNSTEYKLKNYQSKIKLYLISGILGALVGIFYVLLAAAVKNPD